jgi:hypothetical protein
MFFSYQKLCQNPSRDGPAEPQGGWSHIPGLASAPDEVSGDCGGSQAMNAVASRIEIALAEGLIGDAPVLVFPPS